MRPRPQSTTIDLHAARKTLRGLPARRLDSDWLAVDEAGHIAFFAGNDRGPIPEAADVARISEALEALVRAARAMRGTGNVPESYRRTADRRNEPIFDPPVTTLGEPAHETPVDGYPLLVVGAEPGLRAKAAEWNGREALARDGFGVVFPLLAASSHEELHSSALCVGCRVLDDPLDPRPRAPELLAAAGLYVFAHTSDDPTEPYRRVAGPSVAADLVDLEAIVQLVASRVKLDVSFEDEEWLVLQDLAPCAPS